MITYVRINLCFICQSFSFISFDDHFAASPVSVQLSAVVSSPLYIHPPHNITRSHINHRCLCKVVVYKELKCKIITINIIHIINNL